MKRAALIAAALLMTGAAATPLWRTRQLEPHAAVLRSSAPASSRRAASFETRVLAAQSTYWRGEYDSVRVAWSALRAEAALANDSASIADIEMWLGLAAWRLGDYPAAHLHGEAALALKQRLRLVNALPASYNALGLLAWSEGRLSDALTVFNEGAAVAERANDSLTKVKLAGNVALVEVELAHFERARAGFERSYRLAGDIADMRLQGNALTNLGMLDVRVGDAGSAVPKLQQARRLYADVSYVTGEQNALGQLSTAYAALGDLQRAFATLDSANALAARHGLKQDIAANLEVMGDLYSEAGDGRKALQHFERAQKLNHELGLDIEQGTVARKIALVQRGMGVTRAAFAAAGEAARAHERAGAAFEELQDRLLLASMDSVASSRHMRRARVLADSIRTPAARAQLALTRARIAERRGLFREAIALIAPDSANIVATGFDAEAEALAMQATAYAHERRTSDAARAALGAVEALERARASLSSGLLRASFVAMRTELYERVLAAQLSAGRTDDAFRTMELARTRDLGGFDDTANTSERAALRRVQALSDAINTHDADGDATPVRRALLSKELTEARAAYETVLSRSTWRADARRTSPVARVSTALRAGEVLLEYFAGPEHVYAFAITRSGARALRLPVSAPALLARIRIARDALSHEGSAQAAVLGSLYDDVLRPFAIEINGAKRLYITPHAALTYLPFAALRDNRTGRYAIEEHTIEYLPVAADLARLRALPALGHPDAVILDPFPKELPGTRIEARAVASVWQSSRVLEADEATLAAMRAALGSAAIVHVSAHGALDARSPLFSFVGLAPAPGDDGRFEIHHVFALRVQSPLVFLSGCETGLGAASEGGFQTGDDASTFSQALLAAGARAVVATAWRIEDKSAAALAADFYRGLGEYGGAEALARAQRNLLRSGRYADPFYWAAYLLTGEIEWQRGGPQTS